MDRRDVPISPHAKDDLAASGSAAAERYSGARHAHARSPIEEHEDLAEVLLEAEEAAAVARAEAADALAEEHEAEEA